MEYYTIYDLYDNIIAFLDTKIELHLFTNLPIKEINRKFKNKDTIIFELNHKKYKAIRWR